MRKEVFVKEDGRLLYYYWFEKCPNEEQSKEEANQEEIRPELHDRH